MGVYIIINVPYAFYIAWVVLKTFLDEKTSKQIIICSAANQYEKMLEYIDENNIPT